jgi:hypothetical protein
VTRARGPELVAAERRNSFAYAMVTVILVMAVIATGAMSYPISRLIRHAIGLGVT